MPMSGDLSLYLHIPFCTKKCPYCHFYSVADDESLKDRFVHAIGLEIERRRETLSKRSIVSIYFGGGTPFLLGPRRLKTLLSLLPATTAEVTIEANPETMTIPLLEAYRALGVNRLSIGVQSFSDQFLKTLHRGHSAHQTQRAIDAAVATGWENISIDLMYDLPGMDLERWTQTLDEACRLPVHHLSLYNLVIEPGTPWFRKKAAIESSMPIEEVSAKMVEAAWERTRAHGFEQYELSAFARGGLFSRHNVGYWQGREFLGFGPSAFSFFGKARFSNVANLKKYCQAIERGENPIETREEIGSLERLREMVAIGLRMNAGISLSSLERQWGAEDPGLLATLSELHEAGLLHQHNDTLCLTDRGRLLYDTVAVEII